MTLGVVDVADSGGVGDEEVATVEVSEAMGGVGVAELAGTGTVAVFVSVFMHASPLPQAGVAGGAAAAEEATIALNWAGVTQMSPTQRRVVLVVLAVIASAERAARPLVAEPSQEISF